MTIAAADALLASADLFCPMSVSTIAKRQVRVVDSFICADTIDDLMRSVIESISTYGKNNVATKGNTIELTGVLLELTNPRSRLSRTESRGKPFSCIGELCWYLAQTNKLPFIEYYIKDYKKSADDGVIFGGYGPRLFNSGGNNQVNNVIDLLRRKPASRQAAIQLFEATDLVGSHADIPCTCTLQFLLREGVLHMVTYMRSNDVFLGLAHDVFCFTMLQEIIARSLSVDIGTYKHMVGSLHIYETDNAKAELYLAEGWQSTGWPMPAMPAIDPWPSIDIVLEAERAIRMCAPQDEEKVHSLDPYWQDVVRLLRAYRFRKDNDAPAIVTVKAQMNSTVFDTFLDAAARNAAAI